MVWTLEPLEKKDGIEFGGSGAIVDRRGRPNEFQEYFTCTFLAF